MSTSEMLAWTNRLKEVRGIKSAPLQKQRMENLRVDFAEAYNSDVNQFARKMHATIRQDYFQII